MSNRFIPVAEVGTTAHFIFQKICDREGLTPEERAKLLDFISWVAFYAPAVRGIDK